MPTPLSKRLGELIRSVSSSSTKLLVGATILLQSSSSLISAQTSLGAVYHIDNNPTSNHVLAYKINAGGTPTYANAYATGGKGTSLTGGDPLFSQDSVAVRKNYLLTVNAGSNSVSLFNISSSDPTVLTMIGNPVDTNGDYPVSVTFNPQGTMACALNGGIRNGFRCYTVDTNGLTPQPAWDRNTGLNITTNPPTGPPNTLSDITFSADGNALFVTAKITNGVFIYRITNGMLDATPIRVTPSGSVLPFSMTLVGANGLLITDPGVPGTSIFSYNSASGMNTATTTPVLAMNSSLIAAPCWSVYAPTTKSYYVIGAASGSIAEVSVDPATLSAKVLQYYVTPNATKGILDAGVATVSGIDVLYVISSNPPTLNAFTLPSAGTISPLSTVLVPAQFSSKANQGLAVWMSASAGPTTGPPTTVPTKPNNGASSSLSPSSVLTAFFVSIGIWVTHNLYLN